MVYTESPGSAPIHSTPFATVPSGHRVSTETEATQTLVVAIGAAVIKTTLVKHSDQLE